MDRAPAHWRSAAALGGVIHAREPGVVSCSRPGCLVSRPAASQHWRIGIPYAIWRVTVERTTLCTPPPNVAGLESIRGARGNGVAWFSAHERDPSVRPSCNNTALSSCHYKRAGLADRVDGLL